METIVLKGGSKSNARLLLELARKLNFSAKKLSSEETEDIGLYYSIKKGIESGLMAEEEKTMFLVSLEVDK